MWQSECIKHVTFLLVIFLNLELTLLGLLSSKQVHACGLLCNRLSTSIFYEEKAISVSGLIPLSLGKSEI